jgi:hypothetical protein
MIASNLENQLFFINLCSKLIIKIFSINILSSIFRDLFVHGLIIQTLHAGKDENICVTLANIFHQNNFRFCYLIWRFSPLAGVFREESIRSR